MIVRTTICLLLLAFVSAVVADEPQKGEKQDSRRPKRFAIIFNMGYAADRLPQEDADFEKLVGTLKEAHFNTILCRYTDARAEICSKLGMQLFVDLLASDHHVYKNVEAASALCERLRGREEIYGYHIWSDNIGNTYPGRTRDVANVHRWDATHPVYVGSYRMSRVSRVEGLDLLGYYDFHWRRGGHWGHLTKASAVAKAKNVYFLRYCDAAPGRVGVGNVNRCGYTIATSIPFGLKGYMFHYGGGVIDDGGSLDALGKDLQQVNARFKPLETELMQIGNPTAVFSTPVTKSAKDRPTGSEPAVPAGLTAVPADHWFQITAGEVLVGSFKNTQNEDVLALASHNAYQPQEVVLKFAVPVKQVRLFSRGSKQWTDVAVTDGAAKIQVPEYATLLVKIER